MRFSALSILLLVTACQTAPPEMTEAEVAQIEAEVLEAMEANFEGWRQHSASMIMATFHPTATSWVAGATPRDFGGVSDWVNSFVEGYTKWEGGWIETTVTVLGRDAAVFQGTYECTTSRNDGRVLLFPGNASWTNLVERTPDGWKITKGSNAGGTGVRIDQVFGTYDFDKLFTADLPNDTYSGGTLEWRPDGTWTGTYVPVDGSDPGIQNGRGTIGPGPEGCVAFTAWQNETPDETFSGTVCDGVLDDDEGTFHGQKRQ